MREVKIQIKMEQIDKSGQKDSIEFITVAKLYNKNNDIYLVYEESGLTGINNTTTTIKIQDRNVSIKRYGELKTLMVFEEGKTSITKYQTLQGLFNIDIITNKLDVEYLNEDTLNLYIDYNLRLDNLFDGNNKLYLKAL